MNAPQTIATDSILDRTTALLGGNAAFSRPLASRIDAHDALQRGLPVRSLNALLREFPFLTTSADFLEHAVGMSLRTYQRRREADTKPLSAEQSNRIWKFAELVARATDVFGSQDEAVAWLTRPAAGLDRRRPIDLIGTAAGLELVEDHLTRLDYGVYA